ncbi:MAG: trigger factor [Bacteroidaceae bacterium]|nr:trigger factor [Bacteroidaceae bacterium]
MNISLENVSANQALLTINLQKEDWSANVDKAIKDYRKKVNMPGFRPGMVPVQLIQKMYGKTIKAEEINKILQDKIYAYIKDNKVEILGEPMPNDTKDAGQDIDADELTFNFDIALAPQFQVEVSAKDKVDYYNIEVTDQMVDAQVKSYASRNGKYIEPETYADNDMVKGTLTELAADGSALENGIVVSGAVLLPSYLKNEDQKALFANVKKGDVVKFNPSVAYQDNAVEMASLLSKKKEEIEGNKSDFNFAIEEIKRFVEGELNQELFDQVFEKGTVKSEEEFRAAVKKSIADSYAPDSDYKFLLDLRDILMKKVGKLEFADQLLKRIMNENSKDGKEISQEDYDKSIEQLTWHLIQEKLIAANDIKIDNDDVLAQAKAATRAQFAQYGMLNVPDDLLDNYAKEMMKKRETVDNLVHNAIENKLIQAVKGQVTLKEKKVSVEDFNKMFQDASQE